MKPAAFLGCLFFLPALACAQGGPPDPGRLFLTPAQRSQLEQARTRNATRPPQRAGDEGTPALRYDGLVVRSDGTVTRWVDGRPGSGGAGVSDLKPGQIRAGGRVYEPYQLPSPVQPVAP